jgi:luciferase family oxidoreductase group 1
MLLLGPVSPGQRIQAVPGGNSNVPIWLLGSSTFSAQLAAAMGLPFAFAGQFAPQMMIEAITLYREHFKPSPTMSQPYVMIGLPVLAADTDEQAEHLATSAHQRILRLIRGQPIFTPPPVASMDDLWNSGEQRAVESHLGAAVIGGPRTVERKLREFLRLTCADELMLFSDFYRLEDRLRSYEIVAGLFLKPTNQQK